MQDLYTDLRLLMLGLRLPVEERNGLTATLASYARRFSAHTGVEVELDLEEVRADPAREAQIMRIAQEALVNVYRHAGARRAHIALRRRGDRIEVEVRDDGRGIDPQRAEETGHFGLKIMRERAESLGGSLHIRPLPQGGTLVRVEIPVPGPVRAGEVR